MMNSTINNAGMRVRVGDVFECRGERVVVTSLFDTNTEGVRACCSPVTGAPRFNPPVDDLVAVPKAES